MRKFQVYFRLTHKKTEKIFTIKILINYYGLLLLFFVIFIFCLFSMTQKMLSYRDETKNKH